MDFSKLEKLLSKNIEKKKDEAEAKKHGTVVMSSDDMFTFQNRNDKEIQEIVDNIPEKHIEIILEFVKATNQTKKESDETKRESSETKRELDATKKELRELKENQNLKDNQLQNKNTQATKLVWSGQVNELGFFFRAFDENGYIDRQNFSTKKMAKILNSFFWYKKVGDKFTLESLERELSNTRNTISYYPNEMKIPPTKQD